MSTTTKRSRSEDDTDIPDAKRQKQGEDALVFEPAPYVIGACKISGEISPFAGRAQALFSYRGKTPLGFAIYQMESLLQKAVRKCHGPVDVECWKMALIALAEISFGARRYLHLPAVPERDPEGRPVGPPQFPITAAERRAIGSLRTTLLWRLMTCLVEDVAANPTLVITGCKLLYGWYRARDDRDFARPERFQCLVELLYQMTQSPKFRPSVLSHLYAAGNESLLADARPEHEALPAGMIKRLTTTQANVMINAKDERLFAYVMQPNPNDNGKLLAVAIATKYRELATICDMYAERAKKGNVDAHAFLAFLVFYAVYKDRFSATMPSIDVSPATSVVKSLDEGRYTLDLPADSIVNDKHTKAVKDKLKATHDFRLHSYCANISPVMPEYQELQPYYMRSQAEAPAKKKKKAKKQKEDE